MAREEAEVRRSSPSKCSVSKAVQLSTGGVAAALLLLVPARESLSNLSDCQGKSGCDRSSGKLGEKTFQVVLAVPQAATPSSHNMSLPSSLFVSHQTFPSSEMSVGWPVSGGVPKAAVAIVKQAIP